MSINRRTFLKSLGAGLSACGGASFATVPHWRSGQQLRKEVETLGTAKNLVFILLSGAPSHVDTFDLKTPSYLPDYIGPQSLGDGGFWPAGTMPLLSERLGQFSVLRSISGAEAVHERAQFHVMTAHRDVPNALATIPHFGSVLSHKLAERYGVDFPLPPFMVLGREIARNGFLPITARGLQLAEDGSLPYLAHPYEGAADRLSLLQQFLPKSEYSADARANLIAFQEQARTMMSNPELNELLGSKEPIPQQQFSLIDQFVTQCRTAAHILDQGLGVRCLQLELSGWDHHSQIYTGGIFRVMCRAFDIGFSRLLDELGSRPAGEGRPGTLLDETLVVAMGEFGRTTGPLNGSGGRDHFPYVMPAVMAGGGVKPGRIVGVTSPAGDYIVDRGWSNDRNMGINDVVATIYSAMGVDYKSGLEAVPNARNFSILDEQEFGESQHITELFR